MRSTHFLAASLILSLAAIGGCSGGTEPTPGTENPGGPPANVPDQNTPAIGVSAGQDHTCAVRGTAAYCWGLNVAGELGTGDAAGTMATAPRRLYQSLDLAQISAGVYRTCGVSADGLAFCWGRGNFGELGHGSSSITEATIPTPVASGSTRFTVVNAGLDSPGRVCALALDARAHCWGRIGVSYPDCTNTLCTATPREVVTTARFQSVAPNNHDTCALSTAGTVYCWRYGVNVPEVMDPDRQYVKFSMRRAHLANAGLGLASLPYVWCGVTAAAEMYCYRVENGPTRSSPDIITIERVAPELKVRDVFVDRAFCVLTTADEAYCAGANGSGTFGNGTTISSATFVPAGNGLRFRTLSISMGHACGVTLSNELYCWGNNEYGQLGLGSTTPHLLPARVTF